MHEDKAVTLDCQTGSDR